MSWACCTARLWFRMLLACKQRYFANNTMVILDYQITESPNKLNLNVISTLGKANPPAT